MKSKVLLWRWRTNPLRRRVDVLESWIVLLAAVFAIVGGAAAGVAVGAGLYDAMIDQRAERQQVRAVLVEDPEPARISTIGVHDDRRRAVVRFTSADGRPVTATARVPAGLQAGDKATVWTDAARERVTPPPPGDTDALLQATLTGVSVAVTVAGLTWLARCLVGRRLDRSRLRTWEYEWTRVGPEWRRKHGMT
ncbi:hypothetical protein AB0M28_08330 [Streptomyces sp. NPDC051940]|uniref:Rv1733c family protein n=1 Tax=Streptomyces sp. NPDC051940 TaxID=3155675 RepID=UPI0034171BA2